ncbi:CTP:molybdopterin cytidylyltransferase [Fulvivirga imtechensis AK7]|uniref:CTP:molybdopterin cytidylyltransferase n=1 Tax=Fulvivirga imtechensis AK7 TaxID=1237149 RepID=L8JLQ6_9BACT|nr:nucleotidyltransferase family protein [Fulvivirga imtechensis]ELR68312.1 CTP:molybdopterin cytidylyltransferase [Fulvivirga imtechensis AK7]
MSKIGIIILAAGPSSRLGKPKQLLHHDGETLLRRSIKTALRTTDITVTVLGANYTEIKKDIRHLNTHVIFNLDWNKGMGNSLKFGLQELNKLHPGLSAAIIIVCDQPFLDHSILVKLAEAYEQGNSIVATSYNGTAGVPVLFDRRYFKEILKIDDHSGAKALLSRYKAFSIPFPQGHIDIDTPWDWENFNKH